MNETVEKALRESEERYRTFLALSGDAIARLELDQPLPIGAPFERQVESILRARVKECNDPFARLYGYARGSDMLGLTYREYRGAASLEAVRAFIANRYQLIDREFALGESGAQQRRWVTASVAGVIEDSFLARAWLTLRDVTQRKLMENALLRLAEGVSCEAGTPFFAPLVAALAECVGADQAFVGVLAPDGATIRTLAASLHGAPVENFDYPLDGAPCRNVLERDLCLFPSGIQQLFPRDAELRAKRVEGYAGCPLRDSAGRPAGLVAALFERPIREPEIAASILRLFAVRASAELLRSRAVDASRASEKKYRDIVDLSPVGFYQSTPDGRFLMANDSLARLLGYSSPSELLALDVRRDVYFDPEDRDRAIEVHGGDDCAVDLELRLKRKDGSALWVQNNAHTIKDAVGRTLYYEGFVHDISARKRAETEQRRLTEAVKQAAAEWQRTFDAVDSWLLVFDRSGRIVRLNRAASEALGRDPAELIGRLKEDLDSREPWLSAMHALAAAEASGAQACAQARDVARRRTWDLSAVRAADTSSASERLILSVRDITAIVELQETLRRNETMAAMGSLVAGVAHEVRNPLFSISAMIETLQAELGDEPRFHEYWRLLHAQVGRLTQLMQDLLDYGKPQALRLAAADVEELLARSARACAVLARQSQVHVVLEVAESLPRVQIDAARIEQVFVNLISNAIQHSPRGAAVRLTAALACGAAHAVRCGVEDEGPGIPEPDLGRVFEPFFSKRKGGTGLGLSVVHRIVTAHGGQIAAANRPAGGALFTVSFPTGCATSS